MKRAILFLLLLSGCSMWPFDRQPAQPTSAPASVSDQSTVINISSDRMFVPRNITVRPGTIVYWRNNDSMTHRIVLDDRRYDSSDITPGRIGCGLIINDTGTHAYHDMNNPSMSGTITVTN